VIPVQNQMGVNMGNLPSPIQNGLTPGHPPMMGAPMNVGTPLQPGAQAPIVQPGAQAPMPGHPGMPIQQRSF
jgi:hypothetical protein